MTGDVGRNEVTRVRIGVGASVEWCHGNRWTLSWCSPCRRRTWSADNSSACRRRSPYLYAIKTNGSRQRQNCIVVHTSHHRCMYEAADHRSKPTRITCYVRYTYEKLVSDKVLGPYDIRYFRRICGHPGLDRCLVAREFWKVILQFVLAYLDFFC